MHETHLSDIRSAHLSHERGFSLVEALIAVSILAVAIVALGGLSAAILRSSLDNTARIQAHFLVEEGLEAARLIRDESFAAGLASDNPQDTFYLTLSGSQWATSSSPEIIDGMFHRSVLVEEVERDASARIVESGGTVDPDTKMVTVSVSWNVRGSTTTKSVSTYLTNLFHE